MPVLAYHAVCSAFGQWLPNDPRGSGSSFVGAPHLREFGPANQTGRSQPFRRPPTTRYRAPPRRQEGVAPASGSIHRRQALSISRGFHEYIRRRRLTVWACAIMPDHLHLVVDRHALLIEHIVQQIKGMATNRLLADGLHPFGHLTAKETRVPECWGRKEWKVFLSSEAAILREIGYVERNPEERGLPRQHWPFVMPYPQKYDGR